MKELICFEAPIIWKDSKRLCLKTVTLGSLFIQYRSKYVQTESHPTKVRTIYAIEHEDGTIVAIAVFEPPEGGSK